MVRTPWVRPTGSRIVTMVNNGPPRRPQVRRTPTQRKFEDEACFNWNIRNDFKGLPSATKFRDSDMHGRAHASTSRLTADGSINLIFNDRQACFKLPDQQQLTAKIGPSARPPLELFKINM
ncbi:hypothetical protein PGTUg99_007302 [Puccinia graminis f. sp. tritici]|uniref:Uncharacterized protein n=1 Tax=Puccinia graminis f. sp. tritici TaxID=56615 RepID=A0A5B0LJE9_PUCGR|nr:hypothetical protein PGTUg99_007302 [Puccinia graminis f. sp. tritici]